MFRTGEFYHVYNRSIEGRNAFLDKRDYVRFLLSLRFFNSKFPVGSLHFKIDSCGNIDLEEDEKIVKIIAYSLLPNHFHLILKQLADGGISEFMKRMGGYTKYVNRRYDRSGVLFQGKTKSKHIKSSYYLDYLSAYINGNIEIHGVKSIKEWPWSSCAYYFDEKKQDICCKEEVLNNFKNVKDYKKFILQVIKDSGKRKREIKDLLID